MDPTVSFILQGLFGALMLLFGFILNSMRVDMKEDRAATVLALNEIQVDLKQLNSAVLGKYAKTEDIVRWREIHVREQADRWQSHMEECTRRMEGQRKMETELRNKIQTLDVTLAGMLGRRIDDK